MASDAERIVQLESEIILVNTQRRQWRMEAKRRGKEIENLRDAVREAVVFLRAEGHKGLADEVQERADRHTGYEHIEGPVEGLDGSDPGAGSINRRPGR